MRIILNSNFESCSKLKSLLEKKNLELMSDLKFLLKTESVISTRADTVQCWLGILFLGKYLNGQESLLVV